jgi:hypothetical protein
MKRGRSWICHPWWWIAIAIRHCKRIDNLPAIANLIKKVLMATPGQPMLTDILTDRDEFGPVFAQLWRNESPRLLAFCRRRVDGDAAEADEVLAATALRAWRAFASLREREKFGAWTRQIAVREAMRLGRRRRAALLQRVKLDEDQYTVTAAVEGASADLADDDLIVLVNKARADGFLSASEMSVVVERIRHKNDTGWEAVSARLKLPRDSCALHWVRALPKLRVYVLLTRPDMVGGRSAIREAYQSACKDAKRPLLPLEAEVFRHEILERRPTPRREGWREGLRSAAAKVIRYLQFEPLPNSRR